MAKISRICKACLCSGAGTPGSSDHEIVIILDTLPYNATLSAVVAMKKSPTKSQPGPLLVNKLSVADARHLLLHEGGEASRIEYAMQLGMILVTAWFSARAIWLEGATAWHLMLPLFAQYFALLILLPIFNLWFRLDPVRLEVRKCWSNLALWSLATGVTVFIRAQRHSLDFAAQLGQDIHWLGASIREHGMLWPMLSAALGFAVSLPARFRALIAHGPPFVSVSFGCAAKLVILLMGSFLLPVVLANPASAPWFLWTALLVADLMAIVALWDIRRRLRKLDVES
jgi:hypothetical protein